jgi:Type II secretion system (T2SS), protein G
MVDELVAVEKRGDTLLAFVPFVGPWLILRSERHTREEKWRLSVLSIGLTLVVLAVIWSLMPSEANRLASLRQRIQSEMGVLVDIADQYRADHGSYPEVATWRRFAERADGRFFDPWGRPYRYEPRADGVTLGTLGRDGLEGGSDKDADVTVDRQPPPPASP